MSVFSRLFDVIGETASTAFSGVVEAVGSDVTRVKVGQRVSGEGHVVGVKSRAARRNGETVGVCRNASSTTLPQYLRSSAQRS